MAQDQSEREAVLGDDPSTTLLHVEAVLDSVSRHIEASLVAYPSARHSNGAAGAPGEGAGEGRGDSACSAPGDLLHLWNQSREVERRLLMSWRMLGMDLAVLADLRHRERLALQELLRRTQATATATAVAMGTAAQVQVHESSDRRVGDHAARACGGLEGTPPLAPPRQGGHEGQAGREGGVHGSAGGGGGVAQEPAIHREGELRSSQKGELPGEVPGSESELEPSGHRQDDRQSSAVLPSAPATLLDCTRAAQESSASAAERGDSGAVAGEGEPEREEGKESEGLGNVGMGAEAEAEAQAEPEPEPEVGAEAEGGGGGTEAVGARDSRFGFGRGDSLGGRQDAMSTGGEDSVSFGTAASPSDSASAGFSLRGWERFQEPHPPPHAGHGIPCSNGHTTTTPETQAGASSVPFPAGASLSEDVHGEQGSEPEHRREWEEHREWEGGSKGDPHARAEEDGAAQGPQQQQQQQQQEEEEEEEGSKGKAVRRYVEPSATDLVESMLVHGATVAAIAAASAAAGAAAAAARNRNPDTSEDEDSDPDTEQSREGNGDSHRPGPSRVSGLAQEARQSHGGLEPSMPVVNNDSNGGGGPEAAQREEERRGLADRQRPRVRHSTGSIGGPPAVGAGVPAAAPGGGSVQQGLKVRSNSLKGGPSTPISIPPRPPVRPPFVAGQTRVADGGVAGGSLGGSRSYGLAADGVRGLPLLPGGPQLWESPKEIVIRPESVRNSHVSKILLALKGIKGQINSALGSSGRSTPTAAGPPIPGDPYGLPLGFGHQDGLGSGGHLSGQEANGRASSVAVRSSGSEAGLTASVSGAPSSVATGALEHRPVPPGDSFRVDEVPMGRNGVARQGRASHGPAAGASGGGYDALGDVRGPTQVLYSGVLPREYAAGIPASDLSQPYLVPSPDHSVAVPTDLRNPVERPGGRSRFAPSALDDRGALAFTNNGHPGSGYMSQVPALHPFPTEMQTEYPPMPPPHHPPPWEQDYREPSKDSTRGYGHPELTYGSTV